MKEIKWNEKNVIKWKEVKWKWNEKLTKTGAQLLQYIAIYLQKTGHGTLNCLACEMKGMNLPSQHRWIRRSLKYECWIDLWKWESK